MCDFPYSSRNSCLVLSNTSRCCKRSPLRRWLLSTECFSDSAILQDHPTKNTGFKIQCVLVSVTCCDQWRGLFWSIGFRLQLFNSIKRYHHRITTYLKFSNLATSRNSAPFAHPCHSQTTPPSNGQSSRCSSVAIFSVNTNICGSMQFATHPANVRPAARIAWAVSNA